MERALKTAFGWLIVGVLVALVGVSIGGLRANATLTTATAESPYQQTRWEDGAYFDDGICVENKMSGTGYDSGILFAVLRLREANHPEAYYRDNDGCDHLPWDRKVVVFGFANSADTSCGETRTWLKTGTRIVDRSEISINMSSARTCNETRTERYHIAVHELGHAVGGLADINESTTGGWNDSPMSYKPGVIATVYTSLDAWRMGWNICCSSW